MGEKVAYIGVDPGKSGFVTIFDGKDFKFYPMPTHKVATGEFSKTGKAVFKTEFYERGLQSLVFKIKEDFKGYDFVVAIEKVGGRGGWSATNNFNFGYVAGLLKMIFIQLTPTDEFITMVRPQKWQSHMREGYKNVKKLSSTGKTMVSDPKAMAQIIVETEYPHIDFRKTERSKKNDDNKIDSFLICLYLYRTLNRQLC